MPFTVNAGVITSYSIHYTKLYEGVLLTTKVGERTNSMVIGWGTLGIEWGKTIFTVFVRENRNNFV